MHDTARGRTPDRLFTALVWIAGIAGMAIPLSIVVYLLVGGAAHLSWEFLTEAPRGFLANRGGIWPAIEGTLALVVGGLVLSLPAAMGGAVYLSEYCPEGRVQRTFLYAAEWLASVPALLYGLWGFSFLVVFCGFGISLGAGIVTLAAEMFPVILIGAFAALRAVDPAAREAALALGASRAYLVRRILLPRAWPGIIAAVILAAGHAAGSAAPVLFTASVYFSRGGIDLGTPVMTLPTHLYYVVGEGRSLAPAFATALVLVVGMLFVNAVSLWLRAWGRRGVRAL